MTKNEILNKVFNELPEVFSTNEFCQRLKQSGFSDLEIKQGYHLRLISKMCEPMKQFKRVYIKKNGVENVAKKYDEKLRWFIDEALDLMTDTFTSAAFVRELRNLGMNQKHFKNSYYVQFMNGKAKQVNSHNWVKVKEEPIVVKVKQQELNESDCINYLKKLGYKILRSTVNYEEI
jgi:hypothetical protein